MIILSIFFVALLIKIAVLAYAYKSGWLDEADEKVRRPPICICHHKKKEPK